MLRELDRLQPKLQNRSRELLKLRPEGHAEASHLGCGVAQGDRAPPRAAIDEPGGHRELSKWPSGSFGAGEQALEERAQRSAQRELVPDSLREDEHLGELSRRLSPAYLCLPPTAGQAPSLAPVRAQSLGDRAGRKLRELADAAQAETLELSIALARQGQQRKWKRLQERFLLLLRDEQDLTGSRDARSCEGREAARRRPNPRVPARADGSECPLERRSDSSVQPLDTSRLEDHHAMLDRIDAEARVLETAQDLLPLPLDRGRIAVDENERRTSGERLPQTHPRLDAYRVCGRGYWTEKRLPARVGRQCGRHEREPRSRAQRCSQLEPGNEETRDHRNICSIRTYVPLSRLESQNSHMTVKKAVPTEIEIHPTTPKRWDDVADLFERPGPRGGTPQTDGCWCQFWHLRGNAYFAGHGAENRKSLAAEIRGGGEPGLLAYVGGEPVGWCRVGARESFDRLEHSPRLARVDDQDVWSVVCFYVHPSAKRDGVARALLEAAIERAAAHGAPLLEGYPVREGHMNIDAYTGYLPMFLDAGFEAVREAGRRTFVRRRL